MARAGSCGTVSTVVVTVLVLGCGAGAWAAEFSGGNGTIDDPFQITTAQQLLDINWNTDLLNRCFVLNNDIDFDSYYGPDGYLEGAPIASGTSRPGFEGWLDGGGHVIRHLRVKAGFGDGVGLIGRLGFGGVVSSLGLESCAAETGTDRAGLLAGISSGTILGCWVEGQVKGRSSVGLLVGMQEGGSVSYSHAEGRMDAQQQVGGLIGRMTDGEVLGCSADCRLEATQGKVMTCGGLIGSLAQGAVDDSFARGTLVCPKGSSIAGGLIGYNEAATIRTSLSLGTVNSDYSAAGLVATNAGTIRSCYSRCRVESAHDAAGLVGNNRGTVMFCYAAGPLTAAEVRGLIDQGRGAFLSYWDVDRSGADTSAGGFGRTTSQMQQAATFRGWGGENEWILPEGDMPRLWWEPVWGMALSPEPAHFAAGSGTADDPYQIQTAAELASLAWDAGLLDRHFVLMQDVNLAELGPDQLLPIGADGVPFCGSFNGQGHAISGLACDLAGSGVGLFGCIGAPVNDPNQVGVVGNMSLKQAQVVGGSVVGALAARLDGGRIERCLVTGSVQGAGTVGGAIGEVLRGEVVESAFEGTVNGIDRVGGLIGSHQGILRCCYSSGQVVGEKFYIGGLVGELGDPSGDASQTLVAFCYSRARTQGNSSVGGLIGSAYNAEVFACYSTGEVQGVTLPGGLAGGARGVVAWGNVWDRQSAGISTSAFGQSQTTAAMKDGEAYAGWEYGGQWTLDAGSDYPRLAWEEQAGPLIVNPPRTYGGGSGTRSDPYLISRGEHLATLSGHPQDFGKHFRLTRDIDLKDVQATLAPIGTLAVPFTGSLDGNYHTLSNLRHVDAKAGYLGLFRAIRRFADAGAVSGLVSSLNLKGASVTAFDHAAALAAHNEGDILFCSVSDSTVTADEHVGGMVAYNGFEGVLMACESAALVVLGGVAQPNGHFVNAGGLAALNEGDILLCSSSGQVVGSRDAAPGIKLQKISEYLGGLVAFNRGQITGCTSTSRVVGTRFVGGLAALNESGWIYRCGTVTNIDATEYAGGLIAESTGGIISGCRARGKIVGAGLAGFIESSKDDVIESCYFQGTLSGTRNGGFVGDATGQTRIDDCYCVPEILVVPYSSAFVRSVSSSVQVSACFWDKTIFAESRNMPAGTTAQRAAITGLDTAALQGAVPLREAGWDFAATWVQAASDYPRLWWEQAQ